MDLVFIDFLFVLGPILGPKIHLKSIPKFSYFGISLRMTIFYDFNGFWDPKRYQNGFQIMSKFDMHSQKVIFYFLLYFPMNFNDFQGKFP